MTKPFDITKPVRFRNGDPVLRVLATDLPGDYPIVVANKEGKVNTYTRDGKSIIDNIDDDDDLVNIPEQRTVWVNFYDDGCCFAYGSVQEARTSVGTFPIPIATAVKVTLDIEG